MISRLSAFNRSALCSLTTTALCTPALAIGTAYVTLYCVPLMSAFWSSGITRQYECYSVIDEISVAIYCVTDSDEISVAIYCVTDSDEISVAIYCVTDSLL